MKHVLGSLDEFPRGEVRILQVGRRSVGIFHFEDGALRAVRNSCPHHGAPICTGRWGGTMVPSAPGEYHYGLEGSVLRCPWHGWEFDLESGRALFDIARSRLVTYPVSVEDGKVVIDAKGL